MGELLTRNIAGFFGQMIPFSQQFFFHNVIQYSPLHLPLIRTFDMVFDVPSNTTTSHPAIDLQLAGCCEAYLCTASAAAVAANMPLAPPPIIPIRRRRSACEPDRVATDI